MGDAEGNPLVPFQINYKVNDDPNAFFAETKKCNESYPVNRDFVFDLN